MFVAKLMFGLEAKSNSWKGKFESQLRLIKATNKEDAYLKARAIGIRAESKGLATKGKISRWRFLDVVDLFLVSDGAEILSESTQTDNCVEYIHRAHQQGMAIRLDAIKN